VDKTRQESGYSRTRADFTEPWQWPAKIKNFFVHIFKGNIGRACVLYRRKHSNIHSSRTTETAVSSPTRSFSDVPRYGVRGRKLRTFLRRDVTYMETIRRKRRK
jgi:hypothetical protein